MFFFAEYKNDEDDDDGDNSVATESRAVKSIDMPAADSFEKPIKSNEEMKN